MLFPESRVVRLIFFASIMFKVNGLAASKYAILANTIVETRGEANLHIGFYEQCQKADVRHGASP